MKYEALTWLETEHLILRQLRKEDADCYYHRIGGSKEVTKYMLWQPHKSLQESQESIEKVLRNYQNGNSYTWAIALAEDDSLIGRIDLLRFDEKKECCSFAYLLGKEFWGRGFGTEALSAVLSFAFEKMELRSVIADHMSANVASGRVMQKVGMHFVERQPSKYDKSGVSYDADVYCITREDWQQTANKK